MFTFRLDPPSPAAGRYNPDAGLMELLFTEIYLRGKSDTEPRPQPLVSVVTMAT